MSAFAPYIPYDYPRLCDICGQIKRRSQLHKQGQYMVCDEHPGERTRDELSKLSAKQRQFRIRPAPNAKPIDRTGPDVMASDEAVVLNFIGQQVEAGLQYEVVTSGAGSALANSSAACGFLGAAGQYLNDLIVENRRPLAMLNYARVLLRSVANQLIAHQTGFGLAPTSTKSTDPRWGGVHAAVGATYTTYETAYGGLALLYAYQRLPDITGTPRSTYLASARAAASFLRNVQAIGAVGARFMSKDLAGLVPLYTGATQDSVEDSGPIDGTAATISPTTVPVLHFWTALLAEDGDQLIGSDAAIAGSYTAAPQQLMSQCITDMREFWRTGTFDVAHGDVRTGLSATTPAEFFSAYPTGSGSWEFIDGDGISGSIVHAIQFAAALSALHRVEGLSAQVTSIDDWLYTFTSNSSFETTANTSDSALARATTGTYDATIAPSTILTVRDLANGRAPIAQNGSSLYDWGSMGLMAAIRAARHASTFIPARLAALGSRLRFADGKPSDYVYDYISLRGRSGLSYQTGFTETILSQSRMVNDGVSAARFGNVFRQQPQAMPVSA